MAASTHAAEGESTPGMSFGHRPALDGLRAIAVYLVVGFHAGSTALQGGFVGVDLFFVLSGFLITSILITEHESLGKIRLRRFYARRLRRLLPAALLAIAGGSLAMSLVSSRVARESWIGDAQSAVLYVSNWHFIQEASDYFAEGVGKTPFLHYWSLSIEEQFYAFFPIMLIGLLAFARKWPRISPTAGISLLAITSLVLQVMWAAKNPTRAYYGTDTRLYQIAIGALVALGGRSLPGLSRRPLMIAAAPVGLVGLVVVSSGLVSLTPSSRGVLAALAAASAIIGLESRPDGIVAAALSLRPMRYLGRISYGTYLWHWPVIAAFSSVFDAGAAITLAVSAGIATAVAALSYELLELPVRNSPWLHRRDMTTIVVGGMFTVLAAFLLVPPLLQRDSKPLRVVETRGSSMSGLEALTSFDPQAPIPPNFDQGNQHGVEGVPGRESMHCERGASSDCVIHQAGEVHALLTGDSHAARLVPALLQLAREHDFTLSVSIIASCRWQLGLAPEDFREEDCLAMRDDLYGRLLDDLSPDLIVAVSAGYAPVGVTSPELEDLPLMDLISRTTANSIDRLLVHAREVLLLEPLPIAGFHVKDCLSAARTVGECAFTFGGEGDYPSSRSATYSAVYRAAARRDSRVTSASYSDLTCVNGSPCIPLEDGVSTMDDAHHVSSPHAVAKRERLWSILQPIIRRLGSDKTISDR